VSGGLGGGTSDVFQAGAYGARQFGPAYVAGAVAFADSWASTSRTVGVAGLDTLTASFDTQSFGARLEGGYHIASPGQVTLTPYGAVQGQVFRTPAYQEGASSGSAQFALGYAGQTATQTRLELGAWADKTFAFAGGDAINVFGRAAYAHDWQSDPTLTATFLSLANASFVVNGAEESPNLALVTLGAEWRGRNGWSFLAKVDGELGKGTQTIAGTARLRYVW
jgi:outer membrane autotransporter protein